jgi:hypothetical protein
VVASSEFHEETNTQSFAWVVALPEVTVQGEAKLPQATPTSVPSSPATGPNSTELADGLVCVTVDVNVTVQAPVPAADA